MINNMQNQAFLQITYAYWIPYHIASMIIGYLLPYNKQGKKRWTSYRPIIIFHLSSIFCRLCGEVADLSDV